MPSYLSNILFLFEDNDSDVDEYLPEPTGSNLVLLEQAVQPDYSDHDEEDEFNIPRDDLLHADDMTDSGGMSLLSRSLSRLHLFSSVCFSPISLVHV